MDNTRIRDKLILRGLTVETVIAVLNVIHQPTNAMISACPYLGPEAEGTPEEIWEAMIDVLYSELVP
jgi:hypothetical protein